MNSRLFVAVAVALVLSGCRESTPPPVATTILLAPANLSLDAIGATQSITVTVNDQHGAPMLNVPVTWTVLPGSPATVGPTPTTSTPTAVVTAHTNGSATITATAGSAKATLTVTVAQVATTLVKAGGDLQTGIVGQALGAPVRVIAQDRLGVPVSAQSINFAVAQGGGTLSAAVATTAPDGSAATTWTMGTNAAAPQEVTATAGAVPSPARFTATAAAGPPNAISAVTGSNQTGGVGTVLPIAPAALVVDNFGNPVSGIAVAFSASVASTVPNASAVTNASGLASPGVWSLGFVAGAKTLTATVSGLPPAAFTATALPGPLASLAAFAGNLQTGLLGAPVPVLPAVRAADQFGNAVPNQPVLFAVASGGGSATGLEQTTNSNGLATVGSWTLGAAAGPNSLSAVVVGSSVQGVLFTATGATTATPNTVAINAGNNQATMAGTTVPIAPSVIFRTAAGAPVVGQLVTFEVTSGGGSVSGATVATDASGIATVGSWTLGSTAAPNTLTATVSGAGITNNPIVFTAAGCSGGGGLGYAITLCFTTTMTATQRAAFDNAAARWATLITGDVPDLSTTISNGSCGGNSPRLSMTIDDVVIFAAIEPIDGVGNVLGSAGFCFRRSGGLPVVGTMRFDVADVTNLETSGRFGSVILHEMGHVLGVGTMWTTRGLLNSPSPVGGPPLDTFFSGLGAIAAFDALGGTTYTGGQKVPVENQFQGGTINSHWREAVLQNELLTGFINAGSNPLSALTVRSLEDIGYVVNAAAADPFSLTLALRANREFEPPPIPLGNDSYTGPVYTIDAQGRIVRIR